MLPMPTQIDMYQEMSALSSRMVEAAQAQKWELLVTLEKSVAALRDALKSSDDSKLSASEFGLKASLIQRILDDDAEIRRHTEPWMEHVRQFLSGTTRRRRVESAYSAGAGSHGSSAG